jgi:hypothetical protein
MEVVDLPPSGPIYAAVVIRPDLASWLDSPEAAEAIARIIRRDGRGDQ